MLWTQTSWQFLKKNIYCSKLRKNIMKKGRENENMNELIDIVIENSKL